MYNLLLSLAVGVLVTLAMKLAGFSLWAAVVPGTLAFLVAYFLLARRVVKQVQALSTRVQKELSGQPSNPREMQQMIQRAVKMLEGGLSWGKWQFLVAPELHAQIAMLLYMAKDFDAALPHFEKASARNAMAKAMEGALYFQRKDPARMKTAFEAAVKTGKKESLVWAVYAWCLVQLKERGQALQVLGRAVEANPSDEKLKGSLSALQNDKRLKMRPYEPHWWQFGLEPPPTPTMGGRRVQFLRR
ncbi:MAG: tetratricopeptide repeat protein [Myxococcaceae bacterium]|nr:tetratricopeptide repeat protein [Myxococcaceae bacterium]MCI0671707.1 tetratricopeptide repeat protein [Myxococcaceae bacterium]